MKIKYPDYQNCTANLACSILKEFGAKYENPTLALCDQLLSEHTYQNIVVLLLDGMGQSIIERHLDEDGFFRSHLTGTYSTVFPPTTVAATTSIDNGLYPSQHGWLGWDCYFKEIDKNVTVFLNKETGTGKSCGTESVAWKYRPYTSVQKKIEEAGTAAFKASPYEPPFPKTFEEVCERVRMLCAQKGRKYIYAYCAEPDYTMHLDGCSSEKAGKVLRKLEVQIEELCGQLHDTLVLIIADHGHIDSKGTCPEEHPELAECLVRLPSIEPRALNLFVKEEKKELFKERFHKAFGDKFLLLTQEDVLEKQLFGIGTPHEHFQEMLGDYLAAAVDDLSFYGDLEEKNHFIGVHAGLTEEEMTIPLIAIKKW